MTLRLENIKSTFDVGTIKFEKDKQFEPRNKGVFSYFQVYQFIINVFRKYTEVLECDINYYFLLAKIAADFEGYSRVVNLQNP